jgi:hypothetical protein
MLSLFLKDSLESNPMFARTIRMALANKIASVTIDPNASTADKALAAKLRDRIDAQNHIRLLIAAKAELVFGSLSEGEIIEAIQTGDSQDSAILDVIDTYWSIFAAEMNPSA